MPHHSRWQLANHDEHPLYGNTHLPDGDPGNAKGVIVLCHGFKGYKDYGFFPQLAERCAEAGIIAHRFNFSFSGMTHDIDTFAKADVFEHDTWGRQVQDVLKVVERIDDGSLSGKGLPLTLFGHSRGGLTAILAAAKLGARLSHLIPAAAVADPIRLDEITQDMLLQTGRLPIESARTGQTLYIGRAFLQEIRKDPDAFDPVRAIAQVRVPTRIIHGEADPTVGIEDAHALSQAKPDAEVFLLPDADHVFNAPNPLALDETPPAITQAFIEAVTSFCAVKDG